jgi:hypothetical protein
MSDNRDESFDEAVDEGVDVETPSVSRHVCDVCGREFDSLQGLRMHKVRVHHSGQGVGTLPYPMEIPDALTQLKDFLRVFGLNERDSQAVIKYMEAYSIDDLVRLNMALRDIGLALNRRKLLIESWANLRNIPIVEPLRKELNIQPMPSFGPSSPYGLYGEQPQPKQEDMIDKLLKWEELKLRSQIGPSQTNPLEAQAQYQAQVESLRQEIQSLKETHSKEIQSFKEALEKKEREILENRVRALEEQLRRLEESPRGETYKLDEYRLLADSLATISKKEPLDKLKEMLPQILSMAYGVPQEKIQQQTPQARLGLIELLRQKGLTVPQ